ncbi:MAG: amino acid permease [Gemmatimonadaceae bacterium]|nr:amino acid permease [Gloeobacterales cyanobacterium ES-bin-141]
MTLSRYLAKKTVADLQTEATDGEVLRRSLGPLNLLGLGIGAIIGAGIFVLTGTAAAQYAGPAIVLSFILGAIACAFAGLCYAEFAALIPIAGSAYTYAYATLGELFAWIIGWDLILEYSLGAATVAVGWSGYIVSFLRDLGIVIPPQLTAATGTVLTLADGTTATALFNLPALLGILAVTALLVVGVRESASLNGIIVIIKVAVILAFLAFGVSHVDAANWVPFIPENTGKFGEYGISGILRGAGVIFFAYIGFDAVSTAAQEAKNPQKDMPIGILGSLFICTVLYILVAGVLTGLVPYQSLNVPDPIAVGVDAIGLAWLAAVVKIGAIFGLSSVMLVLTYGQTRIFFTMAQDGLMPALFKSLHPRFKTPHVATIMLGTIVGIVAALTPISVLGELVSIGTLFAFIVVCAGVLYLRNAQPDLPRPFRCPLVPFVPIAGILSCLYLVSGLPWETWLRLIIWLAIGMVFYFVYGRVNSTLLKKSRV